MGTKDPRADAEKYLEKHNVRGLFKHLSTKVLFAKPEDPKAFLVQELKRVQECQQEQKPVSIEPHQKSLARQRRPAPLSPPHLLATITNCGAARGWA